MRWCIVLTMLLLAACARVEAVRLQHPGTGDVVQYGPYVGLTGYTYSGGVVESRGCIEDYKQQGYKRVR